VNLPELTISEDAVMCGESLGNFYNRRLSVGIWWIILYL